MTDMRVDSGAKTLQVEVTDLDVGFLSGEVRQFTLFPEDTYKVTEQCITIRTITPEEKVVINQAAIAWTSERHRMMEMDEPQEPTA